jgi:hypothetical protein
MTDPVAGCKHSLPGRSHSFWGVNVPYSSVSGSMRSDRAHMSTCQEKTTDGCRSLAFRLPRGTRERQKQSQKLGRRVRPCYIHLDPNLSAVKETYDLSVVVLGCMCGVGRDGVMNVAGVTMTGVVDVMCGVCFWLLAAGCGLP